MPLCVGEVAVFIAHFAAGRSEEECGGATGAAETRACWSPVLHHQPLLVPGDREDAGRFLLRYLTGSFDCWKAEGRESLGR